MYLYLFIYRAVIIITGTSSFIFVQKSVVDQRKERMIMRRRVAKQVEEEIQQKNLEKEEEGKWKLW